MGHVCLGWRYVKASKGFTPSGPVTDKALITVALQQFNFSVLFFFSSSCPCFLVMHKNTHTARSRAHKSRCTGFHLTPTVSLGSSQHSAPSPAPPLISISFIKHTRTCFFFCRSGWPSVTEQHIFMGSDEAGWHSRTHAWPVPGWGWSCTRCENKATLSRRLLSSTR